MGKSSTSSKLKREILQGDELRQLRQKVISIIEVHSDWGYTDVARLILDGNNAMRVPEGSVLRVPEGSVLG